MATLDTRVIFAYILKVNDCDLEYVGRYKDQKAYSYFGSSFIDTIFINNPSSCRVEIKYFYILKFSLPLQFQIKNAVDIGTKRTWRYLQAGEVVWQMQAEAVTM